MPSTETPIDYKSYNYDKNIGAIKVKCIALLSMFFNELDGIRSAFAVHSSWAELMSVMKMQFIKMSAINVLMPVMVWYCALQCCAI